METKFLISQVDGVDAKQLRGAIADQLKKKSASGVVVLASAGRSTSKSGRFGSARNDPALSCRQNHQELAGIVGGRRRTAGNSLKPVAKRAGKIAPPRENAPKRVIRAANDFGRRIIVYSADCRKVFRERVFASSEIVVLKIRLNKIVDHIPASATSIDIKASFASRFQKEKHQQRFVTAFVSGLDAAITKIEHE